MPPLASLAARLALLPPLALLLAANPGEARARVVGDGAAWALGVAFMVFFVAAVFAAMVVYGTLRRREERRGRPRT
jgi:hypothetical protein